MPRAFSYGCTHLTLECTGISLSMRGRCVLHVGAPSHFFICTHDWGCAIKVEIENLHGRQVTQFYVPYTCYCVCSLFTSLGVPLGGYVYGAGARFGSCTLMRMYIDDVSIVVYAGATCVMQTQAECAFIGGVFTYAP